MRIASAARVLSSTSYSKASRRARAPSVAAVNPFWSRLAMFRLTRATASATSATSSPKLSAYTFSITSRRFSSSAPAAPVAAATWLVAVCHSPPRSVRYLVAAMAPVPIAASPAVITVDTLLAAFWMVASCLFAALVLVPRDLSTFPAIFMASSMTLLFANFKHHLCHFVQVVQRQAQEVVHTAMQSER